MIFIHFNVISFITIILINRFLIRENHLIKILVEGFELFFLTTVELEIIGVGLEKKF